MAQAQRYVAEGYSVVVDLDLEKFFDRVNHDILMARVAERVADKRVLKLIRAFLNAGVMEDGLVRPVVDEGTPQGGPLSPLLSNLVLNDLDKELERRGHRFWRYADDCNIYVRSRRAGERVMASVSRFLTNRLKLKVNEAKSAVARPEERKFLGFSIANDDSGKIASQFPIVGDRVEFLGQGAQTLERRRLEPAIRQLLDALKNPLYATPDVAYKNAGLCARKAGDTKSAEEYFAKSLKLNANQPQALYSLAEISYQRDDYAAAKSYMSRYLSIVEAPGPEALWLAARVERKIGDRTALANFGMQLRQRRVGRFSRRVLVGPDDVGFAFETHSPRTSSARARPVTGRRLREVMLASIMRLRMPALARLPNSRRRARPSMRGIPAAAAVAHTASVHLPLLITVTSRSFSRQRNDTTFLSTHISVRMVSPG